MDNLSKAMTYGVSALLFIIALSIAVVSYTNIMSFVDSILTTSERHSHGTENSQISYIVLSDNNLLG